MVRSRVPQPLKHHLPMRYAKRAMTIAAGYVYGGGVLLCSDTQQEGGVIKVHGSKMGHFECPGGRVAIAFAGNARYAISAIQKCSNALGSTPAEDTVSVLEHVLDKEYRRTVYEHPEYTTNEELGYSLLISFWQRSTGTTSLFVTQEHVLMSSFESFQAIGSGFELATILSRPFMSDAIGEEEALILAAYVLARVKENVPHCGGDSMFISMRNDGSVEFAQNVSLDQIANIASTYDKAAHELLFSMVRNDETSFPTALGKFIATADTLKTFWRRARATQAARSALQSTTRDPQSPQPSQE